MSTAFDVVFGVFVLLMVVLAVVSVRWGVRRDRAERARRRSAADAEGPAADAARGAPRPRGPRG